MAAMGGSVEEAKSYDHCMSKANAWASAHALSMVMLYHQNIVDLLTEYTNFAFYSIKIRVETPEIIFLSVELLSQARKSECGMA